MVALADITVPITLAIAPVHGAMRKCYSASNAVSLHYKVRQHYPREASEQDPEVPQLSTLGWVHFSRQAQPAAKPLTSEERASVNEFFWSHFS